MIHVHLPPEHEAGGLEELLRRAAARALAQQKADPHCELSVALSDDKFLQQLNKAHRGEDRPTDVLSFADEGRDHETGQRYFGDIVISEQRAEAQAKMGGHSIEAELQLLTIHGVLHLLGHEHAEPEEKAKMWAAQSEILNSLGVDISVETIEKIARSH